MDEYMILFMSKNFKDWYVQVWIPAHRKYIVIKDPRGNLLVPAQVIGADFQNAALYINNVQQKVLPQYVLDRALAHFRSLPSVKVITPDELIVIGFMCSMARL